MRPVRVIMEAIGAGYGNTGGYFYSRLNTIFGNPNTYAGLMSIACLLSTWLVTRRRAAARRSWCTILLMVNAVSYLARVLDGFARRVCRGVPWRCWY